MLDHKKSVIIMNKPDDVELNLLDEHPIEFGDKFTEGDIILFFSNLEKNTTEKQKLNNLIFDGTKEESISSEVYFDWINTELKKVYGSLVSDLIVLDTINKYSKNMSKKIKTSRYYADKLIDSIENMSDTACICARLACKSDTDKGQMLIAMMMNEVGTGDFLGDVGYGVIAGLRAGELYLQDYYILSSGSASIYFDFAQLYKSHRLIKECENCGRFFIPSSRSDEKYCDHIFKNGKTCKQLGYEIKLNSDDVLKEYRKIYKTQNARKQRAIKSNPASKTVYENRFGKWSENAKNILLQCQSGKITIQEMSIALSDKKWTKG